MYLWQCMLNFFNPPNHIETWEQIQEKKWIKARKYYFEEIRPELIEIEKKYKENG